MQLIANGLTTVPTHELLNFIGEYMAKEPVERIIIGLPKQMNNEVSENMKNIVKPAFFMAVMSCVSASSSGAVMRPSGQ